MGVFVGVVVPVFGGLLGGTMLLSPTPAVLRMRKTGKLEDINPLPYPMTAINSIGWVIYAFAISNPAILPPNVIGFVGGVFFTMSAFPCAPRKEQDRMTAIVVVASAYFSVLGIIDTWALSDREAAARMWGTSAVVILFLYYLVPLSTMVAIVRTRNAASIYTPLAVASVANGTMWTVYGMAVSDLNIWLPNLFGALLGVVQVLLRFIYGARPGPASELGMRSADMEAAFDKVHASEWPHGVDGRTDSGAKLLAGAGAGVGPGPGAEFAAMGTGVGAGSAAASYGGNGSTSSALVPSERPPAPSV